ncbi:TPA: hypothetical protein DEP90_03220 [Patescibacteria group bacterium]|nr:hypothetical protein [Patescibacteria group bacterium]
MFIAHAPISYLANEVIQKKKLSNLKPSQQIFVVVCSLVFGVLPDMDLLVMMMTDRPPFSHHDVFTHTFTYWIAVWLLLSLISKLVYPHLNNKMKQFLTKDFLNILLKTFLIAGISHFLADLLVGNIMLLYPFTTRPFTILKYIFEPSYFSGYALSVFLAIEFIFIAIALLSLSRKFLKKFKWDDIIVYILLSVTGLYLLFTMFINTKTYNNSFLDGTNKPYIDCDMDFDTLRDSEDADVDNNGIDNILDVDEEGLVVSIKDIVNSNKLAISGNGDLKDWIITKFGGLNSYRLVSQAFYENYSPIEPVLKDFYIKSLDKKKYTVNLDYQEVLRNYLLSKDLLIDLNLEGSPLLASGKVFFLIDENDEIMNIGMSMDGNEVAIVLPGEEFVQYHTYEGIRKFYGNTISIVQICL